MVAKSKLTPEQWAQVYATWQADPRPSPAWLRQELDLPITNEALRRHARRHNWTKDAMPAATPSHEAAPGKRPGRPTDYRPEYAEQARKLCMLFAATDADLAEYFDVSMASIGRWKVANPEFRDTLKSAKQEVDSDVAVSLYKMATGGYSHPDVHICVVDGAVIQTPMTRHYPPSVTAQIFWLKNRQSKHWRDKVEVEQEINHNVFPPKEVLDAIYAKSLAEAAEMEKMLVGRRERLGIAIGNRENGEDT